MNVTVRFPGSTAVTFQVLVIASNSIGCVARSSDCAYPTTASKSAGIAAINVILVFMLLVFFLSSLVAFVLFVVLPPSSPAYAPATPGTPVHRCVLIHRSGLVILLRKLPLSAELLIILVLRRPTHIDHVLRRVSDNVVGFPVLLYLGYLANLKLLELLLLRRGLGGNRFKAGGYEHAPFVLYTRRCGGTASRQR